MVERTERLKRHKISTDSFNHCILETKLKPDKERSEFFIKGWDRAWWLSMKDEMKSSFFISL